jgi:hypothetical protein
MLECILWDYDQFTPNDEIGRAQIKLTDLQKGDWRDMWVDITSKSEKHWLWV